MTREEVIKELEDIRAVIDADGDIVAEDSLDVLADRLKEEGSKDISKEELNVINELIYSMMDPETICNELINMLMSVRVKVDEDIDPFVDDYWDDITPEEEEAIRAENSDVFDPMDTEDHTWESIDKVESEAELVEDVKTTPVSPELENKIKQLLGKYSKKITVEKRDDRDGITIDSILDTPWHEEDADKTPHDEMIDVLKKNGFEILIDTAAKAGSTWHSFIDIKENLTEGHFRDDSIIDGDIPGKVNGFEELITMRFHNLGYDYYTHPLYHGNKNDSWNPYKENSFVMYGPTQDFFDKIVSYIESEVNNEGSAWWKRPYQVVEVTDKYNKLGKWALCIYAEEYDRDDVDLLPDDIKAEYTRRRKLRRAARPAA